MSVLEAQSLSFSYGKNAPVFENFSLIARSDERVALRAPSGFGKTTLAQMLAGYLEPTKGQILLDGQPLPARGICPVQMIWQHPETAVDPRLRMEATLGEAGSVDERIIEGLGIQAAWMSRYPHELSGGEMQRFCIARALTAHPSFLVADEISTMLDAVTQAQIWKFLVAEVKRQHLGLVFVSHSSALTNRIATRVVDLGNRTA